MPIEWTTDLEIGIAEIDKQHKELFSRLDHLRDAMNKGKNKEELDALIRYLEEYVVAHFKTEYGLMESHEYPGYAEHRAEHEAFIEKFNAWKKQYELRGATPLLAIEVKTVVSYWLGNHIGKTDQALGAFLKQKEKVL